MDDDERDLALPAGASVPLGPPCSPLASQGEDRSQVANNGGRGVTTVARVISIRAPIEVSAAAEVMSRTLTSLLDARKAVTALVEAIAGARGRKPSKQLSGEPVAVDYYRRDSARSLVRQGDNGVCALAVTAVLTKLG